jgi:hypothetical protein
VNTFPKRIFVRWEPDENKPSFMVVEIKNPGGDDGEKVAIYEFKEIKTKRVRETLE